MKKIKKCFALFDQTFSSNYFSFLLRSYSSSEMLEFFLSGISFSSYSSSGTTIGVELSFSIVYFAMSLSSGFSSRIF